MFIFSFFLPFFSEKKKTGQTTWQFSVYKTEITVATEAEERILL